MANLSRSQLSGLAQSVGFTGNDVNIAVAVALAESGGNPRAYNGAGRDNSYGLWQINMIGSLGPARRKQFGLTSNDQLYDPATNARAAFAIKKGSGWSAWTTYTSGKYKRHMSGTGTIGNAPSDASATANATPATDGGIVTGGLNALGNTLFRSAANFGGILVAVVLIAASIIILAMQSKVGKTAVKTVSRGVIK